MKKFLIFLVSVFLISCVNNNPIVKTIDVIPKANHVEFSGETIVFEGFVLENKNEDWKPQIEVFKKQLALYHQINFSTKGLKLVIEKDQTLKNETYQLSIKNDNVLIKASSEKGCFYALQSLLQLIKKDEKLAKYYVPVSIIEDEPRFAKRGVMLDVSRHFFDVEEVKRLIDVMAIHKLNVFHWHLTDTDGWRIEIKKYPKLTEIGSVGDRSNPTNGKIFYTQGQIKSIITYAQERGIEIIPEIDMPGHARAAVKAYPEHSGGGSKQHPDFTFNPASEKTFEFLVDILKEIAEIFPSKNIHIGGDEVHFGNENWWNLKEVKQLMKDKNYTNLVEVEHDFIRKISGELQKMNKTLVGWDEIINAKIPTESSLIMWWRHDKKKALEDALTNGYSVILCPRIPLYFDFVQHESHVYGRKWGGEFCPTESVYQYPSKEVLIKAKEGQVVGIQANIWTEVIHNKQRLDYMTFPRLTAFSEAAWTNDSLKNYQDFENRLTSFIPFYKAYDIYFYDKNNENQQEVKGPVK